MVGGSNNSAAIDRDPKIQKDNRLGRVGCGPSQDAKLQVSFETFPMVAVLPVTALVADPDA